MQGHGALLQVIHGDTECELTLHNTHCTNCTCYANNGPIQAEDMPEPKTMLNVTIEANNVVSMATARELYEEHLEELVGGDK